MKFRSLILMGSILSFMVSCNHTLEVNSLPESVIAQINDTLRQDMLGKNISMKLSNGRCLSILRYTPGIFVPQPYDVECNDPESLGDIEFSYIDGDVNNKRIFFKIHSAGFRTKFYSLSSVDINKNCDIESLKLDNFSYGSIERVFPTQELSLANERFFKGKKVGKYSRIDGVEKMWSVIHSNEESLENATQLFGLLKDKIQTVLESLSDDEMEELGISQKAKKRCAKIK